jgi:hypothetical protein
VKNPPNSTSAARRIDCLIHTEVPSVNRCGLRASPEAQSFTVEWKRFQRLSLVGIADFRFEI